MTSAPVVERSCRANQQPTLPCAAFTHSQNVDDAGARHPALFLAALIKSYQRAVELECADGNTKASQQPRVVKVVARLCHRNAPKRQRRRVGGDELV